jgi:serine/threonine-protein kinase
MELLDGMGRELVWGLLALQQRFISRAALLAAIDAWHGRPEQPLGQVLLEQQALDPDQAARVDAAIQDILDRQDSDPLKIFHAVALGEALGGLLEQVPDPEWRSRLRRAVKSVGIEEAATSSLTVTSASGGSVALPATDENGQRDGTIGLAAMKLALDPRTAVPSDPARKHVKLPGPSRDPDDAPGQPGDPSDIEHGAGGDGEGSQTTFPPGRDESGPAQPPLAGMSTLPTRYRILRPHAEGGLGAVFVAHDEELHREVALKEILERHVHNTENQLRFLLEAEVTGGLEHPGIVPVYGLGRYEDGRPYYAMRFIRGESLKSAITHFHLADNPDRDLGERAISLRRLLTHFVDVCEAIAYAHSRGVLHRDLKPANVMLGKYGETLVVDWGLAKPLGRCFPQDEAPAAGVFRTELDPDGDGDGTVTLGASAVELPGAEPRHEIHQTYRERPLIPSSLGRSSGTIAGSRVGTPSFMSPEQAAGRIDRLGPASDIYSLGATLYNILTGKPPFVGTDLTKTLARVVKGDFPQPRRVKPSVPRALEGIVLKAMALKPGDRYSSAKSLGDDIEHWMADEPVSAYRDPWLARLGRFARRHKTAVAASAALLVAAVMGLSAGSIVLERERARTDRERALAVKNYRYAYEAAETMLSRVGDVDLADIPQMEGVRLELLETARLQFQNLLQQQSQDPEILLLEGRTRARLGDVLEMLGLYAEAEPNDRAAIDSLKILKGRFPGDDRPLRALARASHSLGVLLSKMNRFKEAETALREALHLREQLAARFPDDPTSIRALAESRYYLGALLVRLANPRPEDKELYHQAVKDQEALLAVKPDLPENRVKLSQYLNNLANLEARTDPARAERDYRKILDLLAGLDRTRGALPGARWQIARASNNLGSLMADKGQANKSAEAFLIRARDELDRLSAEFPGILQYRRELASIFNNLGRLGRGREQAELASESFRQAANLLKPLATKYPQVPDYRQNLAIVQFQLNLLRAATDPAGAAPALAQVLDDQERLIASYPDVPDYRNALGRNLFDYGKVLFERGGPAAAANLIEKAVARFQEALKGDPGNRVYTKNLYEALTLQMEIALELNQVERAARCAELLVDLLPGQLSDYLTVAAGLSRCVKLAPHENKLASGECEERAESYGRRAVELLRKAVERGLLNSSEPLKVEEFVPLRSRQDFIELFKNLRDVQHPLSG